MRKLRIQQHKISQVTFRLKRRDKNLFQICINALKNHNESRATICANEIAEIKRLIKFLYHVELAIERVILRLETISELSDIIFDLKPALRILQKVSRQLFEFLPNISSELGNVNDIINETLQSTHIATNESLISVNKITSGGEKILKEVSSYLEEELTEKLPEPPATLKAAEEAPVKQMVALAATCSQTVGQETIETENVSSQDLFSFKEEEIHEVSLKVEESSLEDVLLEYIKKSKGEVDLMQCCVELNTSYSEIEKALQILGNKGKVKIETKAR